MPGEIALDSSVVVDILDGDMALRERMNPFDIIWLPSIVMGEILFGARMSRNSKENLRRVFEFFGLTETIDCDQRTAQEYARIKSELKRIGKPIPEPDIWIAACCSSQDIPLATRDAHFESIPGFRFERW